MVFILISIVLLTIFIAVIILSYGRGGGARDLVGILVILFISMCIVAGVGYIHGIVFAANLLKNTRLLLAIQNFHQVNATNTDENQLQQVTQT